MRVRIQETPTLTLASPERLFSQAAPLAPLGRQAPLVPYLIESVNFGSTYSLEPGGSRFLMVGHEGNPQLVDEVIIVQNWFEELNERVPVP